MFNIIEPHADWMIDKGICKKKRTTRVSQDMERLLRYLRLQSAPWETVGITDDLIFNPFDQLWENTDKSTRAYLLVNNRRLI